MHESEKWKWSRSVVSDSSWPHGLQPTRLLRPWDFQSKRTGVGCHCLLYFLASLNNAAVIMRVQISLWDPVFSSFGWIPGSEIIVLHGGDTFNIKNVGFFIFEGPPRCFPQQPPHFKFPPPGHKRSTFLPTLASTCYFVLMIVILTGMGWYLIVVLICISLVISDIEHFFIYLLAVVCIL